jgi:hypothetical protein
MVDNSNSMGEEQAALVRSLPQMVRTLASGQLLDPSTGEVIREFTPVRSLQVGVVSSDMGTGGFMVTTCDRPNFGDDGVLRSAGDTDRPGCMPSYPLFLTFDPSLGGDPDSFSADSACVLSLGLGGCGFEQPLEATLKAVSPASAAFPGVSPAYAPPTFIAGTSGHADGANRMSPSRPFLRENSVLAVILLTDEEDCSAADPELFNPSSTLYGGVGLNLRCSEYEDRALHTVDRYIGGLLQLRRSPGDVIYSLIAGIPVDLVSDPDITDYEAILGDPRMQNRPAPDGSSLVPSCDTEMGLAFPPQRMVEVARGVDEGGGRASLTSICQSDYSPAMRPIILRLSEPPAGCI